MKDLVPRIEGINLRLRLQPVSISDEDSEITKKLRRSERNKPKGDTPLKQRLLPSALIHHNSTTTEAIPKSRSVTPPSQIQPKPQGLSPPSLRLSPGTNDTQTQPFSQFIYPPIPFTYEVEDEEAEQVWGYLVPLDERSGDTLVLRKRTACPLPKCKDEGKPEGRKRVARDTYEKQELQYEKKKLDEQPSSGYLIGRHPECGKQISIS